MYESEDKLEYESPHTNPGFIQQNSINGLPEILDSLLTFSEAK